MLGTLVGALIAGKKDRTAGALVGAGVGGLACAVIVSNARKKDRLIAAQIASATSQQQPYYENFLDDEGNPVTFIGRAGPSQTIAGSTLRPVKYDVVGGGTAASPVLDTGGQECRFIDSSLASSRNPQAGSLPRQMVCRTAEGDWAPYAQVTA